MPFSDAINIVSALASIATVLAVLIAFGDRLWRKPEKKEGELIEQSLRCEYDHRAIQDHLAAIASHQKSTGEQLALVGQVARDLAAAVASSVAMQSMRHEAMIAQIKSNHDQTIRSLDLLGTQINAFHEEWRKKHDQS